MKKIVCLTGALLCLSMAALAEEAVPSKNTSDMVSWNRPGAEPECRRIRDLWRSRCWKRMNAGRGVCRNIALCQEEVAN